MEDKQTLQLDGKNQEMILKDRLQAAGERAHSLGLAPKKFVTAMADAAGCSRQNIYQALRGVQEDMNADYLKRIAIWSRVNELWLIVGAGPMTNDPDDRQTNVYQMPSPASRSADWPMSRGNTSHGAQVNVTSTGMAPRIFAGAKLGEVLYKANEEWPREEQRPFFTTKHISSYCKFVQVNDDAMAPELRKGDWVLVDPRMEPERGKTCLFLLPDESYVIRYYEVIAGNSYEARDALGRSLDRERHGIRYAGRYVLMQRESE